MKLLKDIASKHVANLLQQNNIVAIYQGRSEAGPRALGNRSFLMSPMNRDNKNIMNIMKGRETFRPLAASVLQPEASKWFDMLGMKESSFMTFSFKCIGDKNQIPAVIHEDETCRIQTVSEKQNKNYYKLIEEFYKLTNVPMLLNTSLNLAGDALVETPEDALETIKKSNVNYLYFPEDKLLCEKQ
jgi:carbamoyltransferase